MKVLPNVVKVLPEVMRVLTAKCRGDPKSRPDTLPPFDPVIFSEKLERDLKSRFPVYNMLYTCTIKN